MAEIGRIQVVGSVESFVRETVTRVLIRPITPEIVALALGLPVGFPRDPADRMIAATAIIEGVPLVTADSEDPSSKSSTSDLVATYSFLSTLTARFFGVAESTFASRDRLNVSFQV